VAIVKTLAAMLLIHVHMFSSELALNRSYLHLSYEFKFRNQSLFCKS